MALWAVAFMGSTPIGGPIAGWVSESGGGRAGLVLGGIACLLAALLGVQAGHRYPPPRAIGDARRVEPRRECAEVRTPRTVTEAAVTPDPARSRMPSMSIARRSSRARHSAVPRWPRCRAW